jgi:ABC-type uncharacterized transport system auxiliary subunit
MSTNRMLQPAVQTRVFVPSREGKCFSVARALLVFVALPVLAGALAGCGAPRPVKYYQITYPSRDAVASDAIDAILVVRPFETSHLYLDDKIVYGFDSPEMGTYDSSHWAEPPVEIIENTLVRGLRASGRFKGVYTPRFGASSQFTITGHLYDFKEVDAKPMVARLNYEVRLRDRKTGMNVWHHLYSHDEPASEKTLSAFVVAMNKNLELSVQEVQSGLEEYFRAHPPN